MMLPSKCIPTCRDHLQIKRQGDMAYFWRFLFALAGLASATLKDKTWGKPTCNDHDLCTTDSVVWDDHSHKYTCVYTPVVCDQGNSCTTSSCDPKVGCLQEHVICDNGDDCTKDSCDPEHGCVSKDNSDRCDHNDKCIKDG
eukprot:g9910.t1